MSRATTYKLTRWSWAATRCSSSTARHSASPRTRPTPGPGGERCADDRACCTPGHCRRRQHDLTRPAVHRATACEFGRPCNKASWRMERPDLRPIRLTHMPMSGRVGAAYISISWGAVACSVRDQCFAQQTRTSRTSTVYTPHRTASLQPRSLLHPLAAAPAVAGGHMPIVLRRFVLVPIALPAPAALGVLLAFGRLELVPIVPSHAASPVLRHDALPALLRGCSFRGAASRGSRDGAVRSLLRCRS